MTLMLVGNVGIVASAGTLILGFNHGGLGHTGLTVTELIGGLFLLVYLSRSGWVDRRLTRLILRGLRRYSRVMRRDVSSLVDLGDHYAVCEVFVREGDWVASRRLGDLNLDGEGVWVLGLHSPGLAYQALPGPEVTIEPGMTLILHGRVHVIDELDDRRAGEAGQAQHESRVAERRAQEPARS